jgi:alpha-methylacyl-CoA racemase
VTVIELAGLGALPFATLKLADMGCDVIRVNRPSEVPDQPEDRGHREFDRGRRSIAVDLKRPEGVEVVLRLVEHADVLVEAMRPGVAERLGVGPDEAMARNPRLVYGRLTGWGQDGPLAQAAAHSINYEAITGAIGSIGPVGGPPVPLLQVLGDFAGGGMHLAYGVACALFEAQRSGKGQVVDAAMVDGVLSIYSVFHAMARAGMHTNDIGTNLFDGGAPFYNVYETADRKFVTIAPLEPHFYKVLLGHLGLDEREVPDQYDQSSWPAMRDRFADIFRARTRDEWQELLEGTDACFAPVYRLDEAAGHPHNVARDAFVPSGGESVQVAPSPRFSRTVPEARPSYAWVGADTDEVLAQMGFTRAELGDLRARGAIA